MIRNYKALTPDQIASINAEVEKLAAVNPDIRNDIDSLPRYRAHYYMATGRYAEAIPLIKAHIADEKGLPNRRQLYDMLAEAARNTGDNGTLVEALSEYNKILAELNAISASHCRYGTMWTHSPRTNSPLSLRPARPRYTPPER